jgi:hypothetical protein
MDMLSSHRIELAAVGLWREASESSLDCRVSHAMGYHTLRPLPPNGRCISVLRTSQMERGNAHVSAACSESRRA